MRVIRPLKNYNRGSVIVRSLGRNYKNYNFYNEICPKITPNYNATHKAVVDESLVFPKNRVLLWEKQERA